MMVLVVGCGGDRSTGLKLAVIQELPEASDSRVTIIDFDAKPPTQFELRVGETKHGIELIEVSQQTRTALIRRDGKEIRLKMGEGEQDAGEEPASGPDAAKDRPAFAVTIDYWRKDKEKSAGGWVWVAPDALAPGNVKNRVEPPDDSATFQIYPKAKYLLQPTFVKHEDGLDHWELVITATTSTEEGSETTSEHTIQIAFDGTTSVPVFEDDFATLELSAYEYSVDLRDGSAENGKDK
jgi:hypothetical protein